MWPLFPSHRSAKKQRFHISDLSKCIYNCSISKLFIGLSATPVSHIIIIIIIFPKHFKAEIFNSKQTHWKICGNLWELAQQECVCSYLTFSHKFGQQFCWEYWAWAPLVRLYILHKCTTLRPGQSQSVFPSRSHPIHKISICLRLKLQGVY